MKRLAITLLIFFICLLAPTVHAQQYARDIIVTSSDGIWTDARAYSTVNDAVAAVGANERTVTIVNPRTVTTLTVPANVTLKFERNGSITNSGQLTINTKKIIAPNQQIFTGVSNIDFAAGSELLTGWFASVEAAFALTVNDEVTLIVSQPQTITASYSPGDDVTLKWKEPGNILTIGAGVVVGNLKNIEAGQYQIFAGAGDFDFLDGTKLKSSWFNRLADADTWIETEEVELEIDKDDALIGNVTFPGNVYLSFINGSTITTTGHILTIESPGHIVAGPQQIFDGTGTESFTTGGTVYPEWWGIDGTADNIQLQLAQESLVGVGGTIYLSSDTEYSILATTVVIINGLTKYTGIELSSNIEWVGNGYGTVLKLADSQTAGGHDPQVFASSSPIENVSFRNLRIDMNGVNAKISKEINIKVRKSSGLVEGLLPLIMV